MRSNFNFEDLIRTASFYTFLNMNAQTLTTLLLFQPLLQYIYCKLLFRNEIVLRFIFHPSLFQLIWPPLLWVLILFQLILFQLIYWIQGLHVNNVSCMKMTQCSLCFLQCFRVGTLFLMPFSEATFFWYSNFISSPAYPAAFNPKEDSL